MHARWLTEIATLFVVQWPIIAPAKTPFSSSAIHAYWTRSWQRFDCWQSSLWRHRESLEGAGASRRLILWNAIRPTIEEVFLSDALTRVLAAISNQMDQDGIDNDSGPIMNSVFTTHEDVRNRCLRLLLMPGLPVEHAVELNRIRYSLEHWTDTFIAHLHPKVDVLPYCFRQVRTLELSEENQERSNDPGQFVAWQLLYSSCQKWLVQNCKSTTAHGELNRQIGEIALTLLHPESFPILDPSGSFELERVGQLIDQTDKWVNELLVNPN